MGEETKNRYGDAQLDEFRVLINDKIKKAKEQLKRKHENDKRKV